MPTLDAAVHCNYSAPAAVLSTLPAQPTETISWEYVGLSQVRLYDTGLSTTVKLLCYDDEGGGHFDVGCEYADLEYLQPYLDLLSDAAAGRAEAPVIPVYRAHGVAKFAIHGAMHDYPELGAILQRTISRLPLRRRKGS